MDTFLGTAPVSASYFVFQCEFGGKYVWNFSTHLLPSVYIDIYKRDVYLRAFQTSQQIELITDNLMGRNCRGRKEIWEELLQFHIWEDLRWKIFVRVREGIWVYNYRIPGGPMTFWYEPFTSQFLWKCSECHIGKSFILAVMGVMVITDSYCKGKDMADYCTARYLQHCFIF